MMKYIARLGRVRLRCLFLLSAVLCIASCGDSDHPSVADKYADRAADINEASMELNNRGVALMGRFDYDGARGVFEELVSANPDWSDARVNLAIATLNRQQEKDELLALEILSSVLQDDPQHLRAHYVSGLLRLYVGEIDTAFEHFSKVAMADPDDAYAAYYVAQVLVQQGDLETALTWYQKAIDSDPYLRSAYYGAALALRRLRRADDARAMLADYERFKNNPRARLAEFKYTRMGPKADTITFGAGSMPLSARPDGPLFEAAKALVDDLETAVPVLTTADIDADGTQDLFVSDGNGSSHVLLRQNDAYSIDASHPLAASENVSAAAWGDINNDGTLDVYLCRNGKNSLMLQSSDGGWIDASDVAGADDSQSFCVDAAVFDADHDGDLDIFVVNRDGPNELINNNRDGSFRMLAADSGLDGGSRDSVQVLANDLDQDRDADLIVIHDQPPHEVFHNDRLWEYRAAAGFDAFRNEPIAAAAIADADASGQVEIYTLSNNGELKSWVREPGGWVAGDLAANLDPHSELTIQDFDGDGRPELMLSGESGWQLYALQGGIDLVASDATALASALPVIENAGSGPALLGIGSDGSLLRWAPGPGRFEFLSLAFTGKEEVAESMRSNRSGIGTQIAVRMADSWAISDTFAAGSAAGQNHQPLSIGLGGHAKADFIAINWSDGVFQTELDLRPGSVQRISETQRQLSSCPVLFAWDGSQYRFVSDVLGVGGIGFLASRGEYVTPRPWEYFRLPDGLLAERNGRYQIKLTEPMEENAYLDLARLHVYDLPKDWSLIMDDRMVVAGSAATGRPIFYRKEILPVNAVNDRGEDVTKSIISRDQVAAPAGDLDHRFVGRLAGDHVLTLMFDQDLSQQGLVLAVDGWVEYPYSQTVFAAWQAGETYAAPTLEARDANGNWHVVAKNFGYPAGMPREMALPLDGIPKGSRALRLTTNMEVYWDRLRLVLEEKLPAMVHSELLPVTARLSSIGYPLRSNGEQRLPGYDYDHRSQYWDTRYLSGFYTRFGAVDELIRRSDGALAIIGPGEEIHMEFAVSGAQESGLAGLVGPSATAGTAGQNRQFVLEVRGYAKDMDMYTRDGGTVGPLPIPAATDTVRREILHNRYNTRFQAGR